MTNSRTKGASGERELARELARVLGCRARRGQQYSGSPDSPDVVTDIPGIHIECKRTETLRLYDALAQARRDAGTDEVPVVIHRRNRGKWIVILELEDLPVLAHLLTNWYPEPGLAMIGSQPSAVASALATAEPGAVNRPPVLPDPGWK